MSVQVSVIIPVYNAEKYLRQCLDSVLNQTFQNLEIIAVDDGSKDCSAEILREYCRKYPQKVRGIYQENQGQSAARNAALDAAKGEYLVFVDSDDYIGKEFVQCLYEKAVEADSDMVICDYTKVTDEGEILKVFEANYREGNIRIPSYISCNRIVRRSLLEKYGIRYQRGIICEDIPFILNLEAVAKNVQIISKSGYFYRTNPKSTTSTFRKKKLRMNQLPFEALGKTVEYYRRHSRTFSDKELEFFICRIWTSLIFDIGRGCDREMRRGMCREVTGFMKKYFPRYYKNPYVKLNAFSKLPPVQKWGTWLFVHLMRYRLLNAFAFLFACMGR